MGAFLNEIEVWEVVQTFDPVSIVGCVAVRSERPHFIAHRSSPITSIISMFCYGCLKTGGGIDIVVTVDGDKEIEFCSSKCAIAWLQKYEIANSPVVYLFNAAKGVPKDLTREGIEPNPGWQDVWVDGWIRDLTEEGIESHPGPVDIVEIKENSSEVKLSYCLYKGWQEQGAMAFVSVKNVPNTTIANKEEFKTWLIGATHQMQKIHEERKLDPILCGWVISPMEPQVVPVAKQDAKKCDEEHDDCCGA